MKLSKLMVASVACSVVSVLAVGAILELKAIKKMTADADADNREPSKKKK